MNYLEFYKLSQEPFSNAPVSRFFFNSEQHSQALMRLKRIADQMKGLAVLVGDIGAGKTTLARRMLDQLPESEFEAALLVIIHSGITPQWLLRRIAQQLGVPSPAEEKLQILSQLYRRLLQIADSGKKAVVLIDEAQMLQTKEIMEEFRGLLNLEIPGRKLITFIFFGLPEIEQNLRLDPPLEQRVAMRFHLGSLDLPSSEQYIAHRMALAGANRDIFTTEAIKAIHQYSSGTPRLINTLADNALFEGFILRRNIIERDLVDNIATDMGFRLEDRRIPFDHYEVDPGDSPLASSKASKVGITAASSVPRPSMASESVEAPLDTIPLGLRDSSQKEKAVALSPGAANESGGESFHIDFSDVKEEPTAEHPFERDDGGEIEDIDAILDGLEDKF